jgi:hypothetical protein
MSQRTSHDELIRTAGWMTSSSPRDEMARVQQLAEQEAESLQGRLANQLHDRRGVINAKERDALDPAFDDGEPTETRRRRLESVFGPTAEELAERVATFKLSPDSERLAELRLNEFAGRLFEAAFEAVRLNHLLDNQNPRIAFVRTLAVDDDDRRLEQLWRSLGGYVIVRLGRTRRPRHAPAYRSVTVFPSDKTGRNVLSQKPMLIDSIIDPSIITGSDDGREAVHAISLVLKAITSDWDLWWIPISW